MNDFDEKMRQWMGNGQIKNFSNSFLVSYFYDDPKTAILIAAKIFIVQAFITILYIL